MSISRAKTLGFALGEKLTSAILDAIDISLTYALDKRSGQTDTLESAVTCANAGRINASVATGANADTTYQISGGNSIIKAGSLSAARIYTLGNTGAVAGDRIVVFGHSTHNITVKDGPSTATLLIVGNTSGAQKAIGEFFFDGTNWYCPDSPAVGFGAFLKTPSSANLAATLTDETGSGAAVFATSPTFAGTPNLSGSSQVTSNNAKGTGTDVNPVNVSTPDATTTTLDSFTLANNTAVVVSWLVTAIKSDSTQGAGYLVTAAFRNNAGTVTRIGDLQIMALEDNTAWDATADFSGTTVRLRVTGAASTVIQWTAMCTRLSVIP